MKPLNVALCVCVCVSLAQADIITLSLLYNGLPIGMGGFMLTALVAAEGDPTAQCKAARDSAPWRVNKHTRFGLTPRDIALCDSAVSHCCACVAVHGCSHVLALAPHGTCLCSRCRVCGNEAVACVGVRVLGLH